MLTLILINVQYLKNVVFSFENGSNGQNHSTSDSYCPIFPSGISDSSHPITLFGEPYLLKGGVEGGGGGGENSMY